MDGLHYTTLFCGCTHGLVQRSATIQGSDYGKSVLIMSPHQEKTSCREPLKTVHIWFLGDDTYLIRTEK